MNLRFIWNLSADTHSVVARRHAQPVGYLIAPNNATGRLRDLARDVGASRRLLFADNGNFELIGKIRREYAARARPLITRVRAMENSTTSTATRRDLPNDLASELDHLARDVRTTAVARGVDAADMLASQAPLSADRKVGVEDLTMATWLSLDLEPRLLGVERRDYRRYNRSVARRARQVIDTLPASERLDYHPVASAVSYNTAYDAGRAFAEEGIPAIAMGFGAYMADANYTDHVRIGRRTIRLPSRLPHRYIRTAAAARGFWDGYRALAGAAPERFHFLGLGAPIIFAPVALAAQDTAELTFDATSPMKDATKGGTLYVDKPAMLKVKIRRVAHRLAREPGHQWNCPCPFCVDFCSRHPFDYDAGNRWHARIGAAKVTATDLRPGGELYDAYPLLSEPSSGTFRRQVNYTRIGHNHWIIERAMTSIERAGYRGPAALRTRAENIARTYRANTSPAFANAVDIATAIAAGDYS